MRLPLVVGTAALSVACASTSTEVASKPVVVVESIHCYVLQPVPFAAGAANVDNLVVEQLASTMKHEAAEFVLVELSGYASRDELDPVALSMRRAVAVRDALVSRGVEPKRLRVRGYAASCPASSADGGEEERARDRRVEAKIVRNEYGDTGVELGCRAASEAAITPPLELGPRAR